MSLLDDAVDELYALDPDRFVPRRTELAKAAKAGGEKEAAAAIGALRKPTQSAFTINRLARTDAGAIDALVDLGTELQQAQTAGNGTALRELNTRRRQLLERLTRQAFDIIGQQSPTAGQREEVNATLTAALADTGVADQLRQGILVRAAESSGFGFSPPELTLIRSPRPPGGRDGGAVVERPVAPPAQSDAPPPDARTRKGGAAKGRAATAKTDRADVPGAAKAAEQSAEATQPAAAVEAARRQRDRERATRERAVAAATAEAERADAAVQEAVARVDAAQQLITRLQRELSTARRVLEEAQKQSRAAEQRQKTARAALNKARG